MVTSSKLPIMIMNNISDSYVVSNAHYIHDSSFSKRLNTVSLIRSSPTQFTLLQSFSKNIIILTLQTIKSIFFSMLLKIC